MNVRSNSCWCAVLLVCVGCQPEAAVQTYQVERTTPPRAPVDTAQVVAQLDHLLVAIVPQQDQAWFFKLGGKAPVIARQRAALESFLATLVLADSPQQTPRWTLPEGWQEKAASGMRAATLIIPDADGALELAVSSLPLTEAFEDFLVPNVNRWLRQLQQTPLPKATILKLQQTVPAGGVQATLFQLSGVLPQTSIGASPHVGGASPHAGGANPHAGLSMAGAGAESAGISQPATRPQAEAKATAAEPAEEAALTYQTPQGWLPGKLSSMRKAAFYLPGGMADGEVTVTTFPDAPGTQMADVQANVQRWAGQVGAGELTPGDLEKLVQPFEISGTAGSYVELVSPAGAEREAALFVAMLTRKGQVWFFKMVGKAEKVAEEREAFREFLASVQLP